MLTIGHFPWMINEFIDIFFNSSWNLQYKIGYYDKNEGSANFTAQLVLEIRVCLQMVTFYEWLMIIDELIVSSLKDWNLK